MDDDRDEDQSFHEAMRGVAKLKGPARDATRVRDVPSAGQRRRREQAAAEPSAEPVELLTLGEIEPVQPHDVVGWKDNGVQDAVFKNLRTGRYPIEASLDLHRKTVAEARDALLAFLKVADAKGWRCVLVSHGRGEKSRTPARIKSYVVRWLTDLSQVIAFHSAQPRHGGAGSTYALLRKSRSASEENRERHGQKSS